MKLMIQVRNVLIPALLGLLASCVSLKDKEGSKPPKVTAELPLRDAIEASIDFGLATLSATKRKIRREDAWKKADGILESELLKHAERWTPVHIVNAMELYRFSNPQNPGRVFKALVHSDRTLNRQLAWTLAASFPGGEVRKSVEQELTRALEKDDLASILVPEAADAIATNGIRESYTIVRRGLFEKNHVSFAQAMIRLEPKKSLPDFMNYLARAPFEELRQLNLASVDAMTCSVILEHMQGNPVSVAHPHFQHLFFFAISRNQALNVLARGVLDQYYGTHGKTVAHMLTRMPTWAQIAFIEGSRDRLSPLFSVFLGEVRKLSALREVKEEIDNVIR